MQCSGHGPNTASLLTHTGNGHPILGLELLILRLFIHLCTLRYEVLHFRFEAAGQNDSVPIIGASKPGAGVIVFATTSDSTRPLAEFHDERITGGILKDLGDAIADKLHRKALYVVLPRKRLDSALEDGMVDGVCYYRPEWMKVNSKVNWSRPFIPNEILLVGREGVPAPKKIEDVKDKTIGTVLGYKYPELDALHEDYRREEAPNMGSNLKKLALARMDYAIVDQLSLGYFRKNDPSIGAVSTLPITKISASCAFSLVTRIPFEEIDSAINKMANDGTVGQILAKYR